MLQSKPDSERHIMHDSLIAGTGERESNIKVERWHGGTGLQSQHSEAGGNKS